MAVPADSRSRVTDLHIAVGSAPDGNVAKGVQKDLLLVKSALLYADHVSLLSPSTSLLVGVAALRDMTTEQQLQFLLHVTPYIGSEEDVAAAHTMEQIMRTGSRSIRRKVERKLQKRFDELRHSIAELLARFGATELIRAVQGGLVQLRALDFGDGGGLVSSLRAATGSADAGPDVTEQYVAGVLDDIRDPNTYPLLDAQTNRLIALGVAEGVFAFTKGEERHGQHVALASHLFDRVPVLATAPLDELIDIRTELRPALTRFRSGMIRLGQAVKAASWDRDFVLEAEQIARKDVEPALAEIDERIRENTYLRRLADAVISDGKTMAALGVGVASFGAVAESMLPAGAALLLASGAWKAEQERKGRESEAHGHEMYFYYRVRNYER